MPRSINRLTALFVARAFEPGYYADGGGLHLQVSKTKTKSWIFRFAIQGRRREMGLGSLNAISLAEARERAKDCRRQLARGVDPLERKRGLEEQQKLEDAKALTFADATTQYLDAHQGSWRNEKHRAQWRSTLERHTFPVFGTLSVAAIDTALVMKVLDPIWHKTPESAVRIRGRIAAILDWASARGFRQGPNPALWQGHLAKVLPARSKIRAVQHHPALPFAQLPEFMAKLKQRPGSAVRALELTILTATRTSEALGARWSEFDLQNKIWAVPASRMKAMTHRQRR